MDRGKISKFLENGGELPKKTGKVHLPSRQQHPHAGDGIARTANNISPSNQSRGHVSHLWQTSTDAVKDLSFSRQPIKKQQLTWPSNSPVNKFRSTKTLILSLLFFLSAAFSPFFLSREFRRSPISGLSAGEDSSDPWKTMRRSSHTRRRTPDLRRHLGVTAGSRWRWRPRLLRRTPWPWRFRYSRRGPPATVVGEAVAGRIAGARERRRCWLTLGVSGIWSWVGEIWNRNTGRMLRILWAAVRITRKLRKPIFSAKIGSIRWRKSTSLRRRRSLPAVVRANGRSINASIIWSDPQRRSPLPVPPPPRRCRCRTCL